MDNWQKVFEEAMRKREAYFARQNQLANLKERNIPEISWRNLECLDRCKSFYCKAKYGEYKEAILLKSYKTIVCAISPDKTVIKIWNDESATTTRHFNSFMEKFGIDKCGIKDWRELPLDTYYLERLEGGIA